MTCMAQLTDCQLNDCVKEQVWHQTRNTIVNWVDFQTRMQVREQMQTGIWHQIEDQLENQVRNQVEGLTL